MIALLLALADPRLVETGVGRFAVYADVASIERDGDLTRMRELQVTETGFKVGDVTYVGGWSRWVFDCRARTADRLDFASLREERNERPAAPDAAPAPPHSAPRSASEMSHRMSRQLHPPLQNNSLTSHPAQNHRKILPDPERPVPLPSSGKTPTACPSSIAPGPSQLKPPPDYPPAPGSPNPNSCCRG
jgi:hypothetical protein